MRVFVASWFFPPQTSSEGIVTYKLLRHSEFEYDVVCADSSLWGYSERIDIHEQHIHTIPVKTDDLNTWKSETLRIFEIHHEQQAYDAIMTRCMPNESLEIGLTIKEKHPELRWICSLADPVANNPYWIAGIEAMQELADSTKQKVIRELALPKNQWSCDWLNDLNSVIREQFYWKNIQDQAIAKADMVITPSKEQRDYMAPRNLWWKFLIVPHSYDEQLFEPTKEEWEKGKTHFLYTGYSDSLRSLRPFVDAAVWIQDHYPEMLERIKIHIFGNYPDELVDRAFAYQVNEAFEFGGNVSYSRSLALMCQADCLLHVDAWFESLSKTGGSIFFAGKLADYMGSGKPILALTGENSPAGNLVEQYGGAGALPWETERIAKLMIAIASEKKKTTVSEVFRAQFDATSVARRFDAAVKELVKSQKPPESEMLYKYGEMHDKALTICVPSYNAQRTLKRTLDTLLQIKHVDQLEVIIVDDGSTDQTAEIGLMYVQQYPESVMLVSKPNGGHGSGINQGIRHTSGRYFRVVDSDDWVDSSALDAEIEYILKSTDEPDAIYTPYYIVNQESGDRTLWPWPQQAQMCRLYTFEETITKFGVDNIYFTMAATSFRTEILKTMKLELREKCFYTDSEFILKPIIHVKTVVFLPDAVYRYLRGQAEQSVAPLSFVRHYADHEAIVREMIDYEQTASMDDDQRKYIRYILKQHLKTNYQILLDFDPDLMHGLECMKAFDAWLSKQAPSYFRWTQENLKLVRAVRWIQYDLKRTRSLKKQRDRVKGFRGVSIRRMGRRILRSRLFINRFTREIIRKQKENNGWLYRFYQKHK